jgi:hypothetical protein
MWAGIKPPTMACPADVLSWPLPLGPLHLCRTQPAVCRPDLIFWDGHTAIYCGSNCMIEAKQTGARPRQRC